MADTGVNELTIVHQTYIADHEAGVAALNDSHDHEYLNTINSSALYTLLEIQSFTANNHNIYYNSCLKH